MEGKNNGGNYNNSCTKGGVIEKKQGRAQEQVNCPRCNSSNTKFCYYNNYSLTQPRYFCKTCRRYWTEGGSLRNVPVGGGSRKNKKFNNISSSSSTKLLPDLNPSPPPSAPILGPSTTTTTTCPSTLSSSSSSLQNPKILMQGGQDLNLAFSPMMEKYDHHHGVIGIGIGLSTSSSSSSSSSNSNSSSALELLRGLNSNNNYGHDHHHNNHPILMMPNSNSNSTLFPSGFSYNNHHHHPMQEVKPTSLGFSVDHHHAHQFIGSSRYGVHQEDHHISSSSNGDGGRLSFPFGDVKQIPEATHHVHEVEQNKEQGNSSTTGFWNGMIGEGSW